MVEESTQDDGKEKRNDSARRGYRLGVALTLASAVFWGSTYPVIKIDLIYYSAYEISTLRATFASAALLAYLIFAGRRFWFFPKDRTNVLLLICASFLGATGFWTFLNLGVFFVGADTSSFLVALYPLIAIVLASVLLKEKLSSARAGGVMSGIIGTFVIVNFGQGATAAGVDPVLGEFFSVLAAFSWAGYMITTKVLMGRKDQKSGAVLAPEYVTFTTFLFAVIPTLLISVFTGGLGDLLITPTLGLVLALYLGVLASVSLSLSSIWE